MNIKNYVNEKNKKKKKVTKHVVCNVHHRLLRYISDHNKEKFEIKGVEFSNSGAQGREPLFDASHNGKGTIMAYWKDNSKNCIVISAPEPGYEVKAPKSLYRYFWNWDIRYLDVSHLDVSNTTDFDYCFAKFGGDSIGGLPSGIIGLETWDVRKGKDFTGMFEKCLASNKTIHLDLSSWRFGAEERVCLCAMFQHFGFRAKEVVLDVSGWNTECVYDFVRIFSHFAPCAKAVELKGVEDWRLGTGVISLDYAFDSFAEDSECCLDLSQWGKEYVQRPTMDGFAANTFFRIKEPIWGKSKKTEGENE